MRRRSSMSSVPGEEDNGVVRFEDTDGGDISVVVDDPEDGLSGGDGNDT